VPSTRAHSPTLRLSAGELAEAAMMANLAAGLQVAGWFLPFGTILQAMSIVPFVALALRHRARAVAVSGVAGAVISIFLIGPGLALQTLLCAGLGQAVAAGLRRGYGLVRTVALAVVTAGVAVSAAAEGGFFLFASLRRLGLEEIRLEWRGIARLLTAAGAGRVARTIDPVVTASVRHWMIGVPAALFLAVASLVAVAFYIARPTMLRLEEATGREHPWLVPEAAARVGGSADGDGQRKGGSEGTPPKTAVDGPEPAPPSVVPPSAVSSGGRDPKSSDATAAIAPLPVGLEAATFTYPGAATPALGPVSAEFRLGEFVVVVGPNGAGKSTLVRLLAGVPPTTGRVVRPGAVGLGRPGGTALVLQRPEAQVLGVRVAEDVVWGLPQGEPVDVGSLLAEVGLDGYEEREVRTLSGGELQRLAVAAALARRPTLLLSDEATAMLDPEGRRALMDVFRRIVDHRGTTVVHVTHHEAERAVADRVVELALPTPVVDPDGVSPLRPSSGERPTWRDSGEGWLRVVPSGAGGDEPSPEPSPERRLSPAFLPDLRRSGGRRLGDPHPTALSRPGSVGRPAVEVDALGVVYGGRTPFRHRALADVSFVVERGESLVVEGGNGSGKSTLAWALAGLLSPSEGRVRVEGKDPARHPGIVALAFQQPRLQLGRATVRAELADAEDDPAELLLRVGLDPWRYLTRRIDTLSGGEQRRVALAALLGRRPALLVLDEPLAGLDSRAVERTIRLLQALRAESGLAVVVVSHESELSGRLGERVLRLAEGRVVGSGPEATQRAGLSPDEEAGRGRPSAGPLSEGERAVGGVAGVEGR